MANRSELRITVTSSRNASAVRIRSVGRYRGLSTNTLSTTLTGQPLFTTASEVEFWTAVLAAIAPDV
jgi:hypothetical protein